MTEATQQTTQTAPGRRQLFGAAYTHTPTTARASGTWLIRQVAALEAINEQIENHPEITTDEEQEKWENLAEGFWPIADGIAATPATTFAGVQAKGRALGLVYLSLETDDGSHMAKHVMGLVRDLAAVEHPDAELLRLCGCYAHLEHLYSTTKDAKGNLVQPDDIDETLDAIASLRARTLDGMRAKAKAITLFHVNAKDYGDSCPHERAEWSLLQDLAGASL